MWTPARKPRAIQQASLTKSVTPSRAHSRPSGVVNSILHLQRTIGNQAVQGLLAQTVNAEGDSTTTDAAPGIHDFSGQSTGRMDGLPASSGALDQLRLRLSPSPPTTLPAATPAWTQDGEINLGPSGLFMAPEQQRRMLRHEAFHSLHQQTAPASHAAGARAEAEQHAANAESGFDGSSRRVPMSPAPALLAFPPQPHAPWDQVWMGHSHIIGEIKEAGVVARILLSYKDIGITRDPEPGKYHCGKHDPAPIPVLVERMRKAAKQAADLNNKLPSSFPLRTAVIAIYKGANNGFRKAGGKGVIVVKEEEPWEGTIAHEASHGIFAFHLGEPATPGIPDALARGIAELFIELKNTTAVSMPTHQFDPKRLPPLRDDGITATKPAGIVMVMDILWAGTGSSDGHPWSSADEFFASAYGAFQHNRPLFEQIVKHYGNADPKIPPLTQKLLALLTKVGDPKAIAALKAPTNPKIDAELKRIKPTEAIVAASDYDSELLVNPNKLPGPETISCPSPKPPRKEDTKKPAPRSRKR